MQFDGAQPQDIFDPLDQIGIAERLEYIVGRAGLHQLDGDLLAPLAGEHDHVGGGKPLANFAQGGQAVDLGHHVVEEDHGRLLTLDDGVAIEGALGGKHLETAMLQHHRGQAENHPLVIDDQDLCAHGRACLKSESAQ